jgi:hypothetical protein
VLRAANTSATALLHQVAALHHRHPVGKAAHQVQVVGDQQHRHAVLALQVAQQVQDLPAQAHVQRGGGLVGDQQLGLGWPAPWRSWRAGAGRR